MRRGLSRRAGRAGWSSVCRSVLALPALFLLAACLYLASATSFLRQRAHSLEKGRLLYQLPDGAHQHCVAWRQTNFCSPYGTWAPTADRGCKAHITMGPGFCECSGRVTVQRLQCGHYAAFTCEAECAKLFRGQRTDGQALPSNISCSVQAGAHRHLVRATAGSDRRLHTHVGLEQTTGTLWRKILSAAEVGTAKRLRIPESRTTSRDWVAEGLRLPWRALQLSQESWRDFLSAAPAYPEDHFSGQGIVILAGGNTYMVPAWVNIHMLRRTGCQLPVEMFFPAREFPSADMEAALGRVGVLCRKLPAAQQQENLGSRGPSEAHLAGFALKIGALLLSSFREVIFLDSDNVAVSDPSALLEAPEYLATGALLWPDFWDSTAAPDLMDILEIPAMVPGSFESGQMVFDKQRAWRALLLTAFFNAQSDVWYELFSGWMGKGDKETFAYAFEATRSTYSVVATPVGSIGRQGQACGAGQRGCRTVFLGNTMTQHAPGDAPQLMFLHANLSPKWNLHLPGSWEHYTPRWQVTSAGQPFAQAYPEAANLEQQIYKLLRDLRCAPFLPGYMQVLSSEERMGKKLPLDLPAQGFHPVNEGVNFAQAYVMGMRGPFQRFTPLAWGDLARSTGRAWLLRTVNSLRRLFSWRPGYFRVCLFC